MTIQRNILTYNSRAVASSEAGWSGRAATAARASLREREQKGNGAGCAEGRAAGTGRGRRRHGREGGSGGCACPCARLGGGGRPRGWSGWGWIRRRRPLKVSNLFKWKDDTGRSILSGSREVQSNNRNTVGLRYESPLTARGSPRQLRWQVLVSLVEGWIGTPVVLIGALRCRDSRLARMTLLPVGSCSVNENLERLASTEFKPISDSVFEYSCLKSLNCSRAVEPLVRAARPGSLHTS